MKIIKTLLTYLVCSFLLVAGFFALFFIYLSSRKLGYEILPPKILVLSWKEVLILSAIGAIVTIIGALIIKYIKKDDDLLE